MARSLLGVTLNSLSDHMIFVAKWRSHAGNDCHSTFQATIVTLLLRLSLYFHDCHSTFMIVTLLSQATIVTLLSRLSLYFRRQRLSLYYHDCHSTFTIVTLLLRQRLLLYFQDCHSTFAGNDRHFTFTIVTLLSRLSLYFHDCHSTFAGNDCHSTFHINFGKRSHVGVGYLLKFPNFYTAVKTGRIKEFA